MKSSIEACYISEDLRDEWEALVKGRFSSGFLQSFFWSEFKRKVGWQTYKIGFLHKEKLIAGAVINKFQFSKNKNFIYLAEGPVMDFEDTHAEETFHLLMSEIDNVVDLKGENLTTHVRIDPRISIAPSYFNRFHKAPFNMEPRNTLMIDLSKSEEEILKNMKQKGRYNIKIAVREGVEIRVASPSEAEVLNFADVYSQTVSRKKFDGKDKKYFEILFGHLKDLNNTKLFFASYKGKILASAIVIYYGDRATYFFGGTSSAHREKMAPYLLHWHIIQDAKKAGMRWYDFWGVSPRDADSSHGWYGFTQFKEKFGGIRFDFIGAYDFVYNEKLYGEFLRESEEM